MRAAVGLQGHDQQQLGAFHGRMLDGRGRASHDAGEVHGVLLPQDPQVVDHRAAALAGEGQRRGHAFAGGRGDGEGHVSLAAQPQAGHARPVLDKQRGVHRLAHLGHVADVGGVDDGRVAEAVLGPLGLGDAVVDVAAADEGEEGHHLLDRHEGVRLVGLAEEQLDAVRHALADAAGQHGGVLAEEVAGRDVVLAGRLRRRWRWPPWSAHRPRGR